MSGRYALALLVPLALIAACATMLGLHDEASRAFPHRKHVLAGVSCVSCHGHVANSIRSSALDLPNSARCVTCHAKPHDSHECSTCHGRSSDRTGAEEAKSHLSFSHRDHNAITAGRCTRCHGAIGASDGPLRPSMATCLSCHTHRQAWAARACTPCHVRVEDEGARPESHVIHGDSFLTRHGIEAAGSRDLCASCHTETDCLACHGVNVPALPSVWHFDQVERADMHAAGFMARHSIEARLDPALCTTCHGDATFCERCHHDKGLLEVTSARASPHPIGWVGTRGADNRHGLEARANPVSCASCHGGAGEALCVGCHRVGGPGGNPHPPGFSSHKSMSDLPCRLCHVGGR